MGSKFETGTTRVAQVITPGTSEGQVVVATFDASGTRVMWAEWPGALGALEAVGEEANVNVVHLRDVDGYFTFLDGRVTKSQSNTNGTLKRELRFTSAIHAGPNIIGYEVSQL